MTANHDIYFELADGGDIVRLDPIALNYPDATHDWDKNWVNTKITIKGGAFSGHYFADLMTWDFEKFKQELIPLYDNLKGFANFTDLENSLELKIQGDGIGHFKVIVTACDQPGVGSRLTFTMTFDQTGNFAQTDPYFPRETDPSIPEQTDPRFSE